MRIRWWMAPCLAGAAALTLAACGSSGSGTGSTPAATLKPAAVHSTGAGSGSGSAMTAAGIKTMSTKLGTVLTDAQGHTLYWFAIDTPTKSNCTGACLSYWPPLTGKASVAAGVSLPGKFGTIKGSNGKVQATYDGHPLYLYKADTAAGQVGGNGLSLSGGKWWAMTPSAKPAAKAAPSSSPSSGGGGGY